MDLRNNQITVKELLDNPVARDIIQKRYPEAFRIPIVLQSGSMTLERAIKLISAYVPAKHIQEILKELKKL